MNENIGPGWMIVIVLLAVVFLMILDRLTGGYEDDE